MPSNPTVSGSFSVTGTLDNYDYGNSSGASTQAHADFDASRCSEEN